MQPRQRQDRTHHAIRCGRTKQKPLEKNEIIYLYVQTFTNTQLDKLDAIISAKQAKEFAETEFEKYRIIQDRLFESDFDKLTLLTLPFDKQE